MGSKRQRGLSDSQRATRHALREFPREPNSEDGWDANEQPRAIAERSYELGILAERQRWARKK